MNVSYKLIFAGLLLSLAPQILNAQETQQDQIIMSDQAIHHDGEFMQVCGIIAETSYVRGSKGEPTYLNFHKPYPRQNFSVIIWKEDRKNFDFDPEKLEDYQACVYGEIVVRRNRAQMTIRVAEQISVQKPKPAAPEASKDAK